MIPVFIQLPKRLLIANMADKCASPCQDSRSSWQRPCVLEHPSTTLNERRLCEASPSSDQSLFLSLQGRHDGEIKPPLRVSLLTISSTLLIQTSSHSALHSLGSSATHPPSVRTIGWTVLEICGGQSLRNRDSFPCPGV